MSTTSKNGFEIRSDLLGLAKSLIEFNYQAQIQEYEYNIRKEGDKVVQEFKAPTVSPMDVISMAQQFNEFVSNNDYTKTVQENISKAQDMAKPYAESYQNTVKAFFPNLGTKK